MQHYTDYRISLGATDGKSDSPATMAQRKWKQRPQAEGLRKVANRVPLRHLCFLVCYLGRANIGDA
jgi:hypothetical protein